MLMQKEGFPEESDLVMCTVTNVQFHSVFVTLDEYHNKSGMIHISEIAPGRIRNIRDYVKEGKKIVCKVLRINEERGHIDLSLRRVNDNQKRLKVNEIKQNQKAEKILEHVAKLHKLDMATLFATIMDAVKADYDTLYGFFEDVVLGGAKVDGIGLDKAAQKTLDETIRQRISLPEVEITGTLGVESYHPSGVEKIKAGLLKVQALDKENLHLRYKGAGKYSVRIVAEDYKTAERLLSDVTKTAEKLLTKDGATVQFVRDQK
ncbi:translation initiation factor IF-2 subunit alpha [Candidatus Woesearchaeota archaeon]|nr:translation initiation factor IF-2 subunit alpha [Candidatus Woesearchaeota archaeon]